MSSRRQYPFDLIEPKWQQRWEAQQLFRAWNPGDAIPAAHPFAQRHGLSGPTPADKLPPKYYILDMFPYPSGAGLHVGHPEGYTATDILARYRRTRGYNVLHPMGWDAFGLPAEQYAIKTGQHPRATTEANIANFKRQIQSLGFSYDWSREVDTTDPGYFRWTQWIFVQLYGAWFNPRTNKAEPISTLVYPEGLTSAHERRSYCDSKRMAYVSEAPVNWCPELGTVLANEEVIDGKSEVGGFPVVRRPMRQWMLRITAYAERLLNDLDGLDWTHSLKEMQRNWIGRSDGAEVRFALVSTKGSEPAPVITVFTTRPDTLFGATYMVLSPEHRLVDSITTPQQREAVDAYKNFAATKSDLERTELAREKSGVFTGAFAINPVDQKRIPVWIADYVLATYGTGAIMAVPGHDTRDLEFATKFNLPIVQVVRPPDPKADWRGFVEAGTATNSRNAEISLDDLPTADAREKIIAWLESKALGRRTINYKLRDWLFSRQRYWGEPFPIVWRSGQHEALPDSDLPLQPPDLTDFKPTSAGDPPLARAQEWTALSDGALRETNTMPQWAGSCWYYLRYLDARNPAAFCGREAEKYWMGAGGAPLNVSGAPAKPGVDLYVGGTEHAVLHLLYSRFWHKVLFDLGHVSTSEPFFKLVNQGLILGELEFTLFSAESGRHVTANHVKNISEEASADGVRLVGVHQASGEKCIGRRVDEEEIEKTGDGFVLKSSKAIRVDARSFKMSKSRGNVISPDVILAQYGADAFRLYEMFMGPLEMVKPWSTKGVDGVYRFLGRVWRLFIDDQSETEFEQAATTASAGDAALLDRIRLKPDVQEASASRAQLKTLHACIKNVTEDLDGLRFNTAISELMVFVNEAMTWPVKPAAILREFLILLQPFAPHIAEELWSKLTASTGQPAPALAYAPWPVLDPALLVEDFMEMPVQVNGKLRDVIRVAATATSQEIEAAALASEKVKADLAGKTIRKMIVVPKKIVNIAAG
ncbi:MAG: leucyl-tRNA synthetase [Verrucomicrobiota bacterium]|jgi:leucyl-tRNA synthetase